MATRHERVIIDLDDRFTRPMAGATAATALFRRELDSSGRQVIAFDKTTKDASPSIDKLSGRLAILGRTAAALGPGLVPITTALVPAIAGLSTQLGFAAAGAGTALLAFNGVGDGLKALNAYQLEPTAENLAKMREEMKNLGPAAREFVTFLDQIGPQLQTIRQAAQDGLLPGAQEGLEQLLTRAPEIRRVISEIADASGDMLASAGGDLASGRWDEFFAFVENEARPALTTLSQTVGHLASGIAELWMAMDPLSDDFTIGLLNASAAFEQWAAGLSQTEGFQDFLAYVRETGPQVMETLGSVANMLIQVGTAAAPLGGPVLTILEALADAIAAIAESDLGTPIMAAAAAFSALSLASNGFASVMGSKAVGGVKNLTADLRTMGDVGVVAWGRTAAEADKFAAASSRVKTGLAGMGKSAALVGGLALATSDLGQSMGVTNAASLALMGTMAGPWGAAIGGGIGLVLDLAAANDKSAASIDAARSSLDNMSLSFEQQKAAVEQARADLNEYLQSMVVANAMAGGGFTDKLQGYWTLLSDSVTNHSEEGKAALAELEAELRQMPGAVSSSEAAFRQHAQAIEANVSAMRALREERLRALNAELNYEASLDDARDALEDNGKTLDKTTAKGRANRAALYGIAEGWNGLSDRMKNADGAHKRAIDTFVRVAKQMGMNGDAARKLAQRIMEIPPERKTKILVDAGQAFRMVDGVRMALRNLDGTVSTTYIRTVHQGQIANRLGLKEAEGGVVDYFANGSENHVAQIAPAGAWRVWAEPETGGEAYIPLAASKRERSTDIWRAVGDRLGVQFAEYASGGVNASPASTGGRRGSGMDEFDRRLKSVSGALEKHKEALDEAKSALQSLRDESRQFKDEVAGNFKSALFGDSTLGEGFEGLSPARRAVHEMNMQKNLLLGDIADAKAMEAALRKAKGQGLSGGLFKELAAAGNVAMAQAMAGMPKAQIREYERLYGRRERLADSVGGFASQQVFGNEIKQQTRELRELRQQVSALTDRRRGIQIASEAAKKVGDAVGDQITKAAVKGHKDGRG